MLKGEHLDADEDTSLIKGNEEAEGMVKKPLYVYPLLAAAVSSFQKTSSELAFL